MHYSNFACGLPVGSAKQLLLRAQRRIELDIVMVVIRMECSAIFLILASLLRSTAALQVLELR